ncbi:hypothetical protein Scep_014661 [Stephania cephalantha]|uniref:Uncharacterized protein n=1 Tax=Stephania cephalantha TaxID=152367 RepID=A0AAP0P1Z6_9MAGN
MDGQPVSHEDHGGQTSGSTHADSDQTLRNTVALHSLQLEEILRLLRAQATTTPVPATLVAATTIEQTVVAPTIQATPLTTATTEILPVVTTPSTTPAVAPTLIQPQEITFESSLSDKAKIIKEFIHFQPGYYYGGGDLEVAGKLVFSYVKLHGLLRIHDNIRARISRYMLRGDAAIWWTPTQPPTKS